MDAMKMVAIGLAVMILILLGIFLFVPAPDRDTGVLPNTGEFLSDPDKVVVEMPKPGDTITSPLRVSGKAKGMWFFEASFPVQVIDAYGTLLGTGIATAQGEWMTEEFAPFEGTISFDLPKSNEGMIVFKRDNPSGLAEYDAEVRLPVRFAEY